MQYVQSLNQKYVSLDVCDARFTPLLSIDGGRNFRLQVLLAAYLQWQMIVTLAMEVYVNAHVIMQIQQNCGF